MLYIPLQLSAVLHFTLTGRGVSMQAVIREFIV